MTTYKCAKCGKARSLDVETEAKYIKIFGSKEKLEKGFLCRDCKPAKVKAEKPKAMKEKKAVSKKAKN